MLAAENGTPTAPRRQAGTINPDAKKDLAMKIKLNLSQSEFDPIRRTAEAFGCKPEDVLYIAVDEYMSRLGNFNNQCGPACRLIHTDFNAMRDAALNTKRARSENLPLWADSAASVHAYEGMPDDEPAKSDASKF